MGSKRIKFGISLSNRSVVFGWTSLDDILDAAQMAEESGEFDGVWIGDNLLSKPRLECIVTLSALGMRTSKVRLGTICFASIPLRDPILLAIQWASLDVLTKGRTVLAVCNGPSAKDGPRFAHELDVMGVASHERAARLVETVGLLRRFWSEESVTHEGRFHQFKDVAVLPKPVQQPPPIFIAVNPKLYKTNEEVVQRSLRRVAKYADGWQADSIPAEDFGRRLETIKKLMVEEGRDPSTLESCPHIMANINDDPEKALTEAQEYLALYYPAGYISRQQADDWFAYGPPEDVTRKIQTYLDAGCTTPVIRFCSRDTQGQMQRFLKEVRPALQTD